MTLARSRTILAAIVVAIIWSIDPGGASPARADDYTMETEASYTVDPEAGEIDVVVDVRFANTTPDPEGQFSIFDQVKLAVQDGVTAATAEDAEGALDVSVAVENDVTVATVELREDLRFEQAVELTVRWTLTDSDDPQLRIRPSIVVFPAWGFGTASFVTIFVPDGYEVRADGDPISEENGRLVSGPIADPSRWLALVTALRPADYVTLDGTVALAGGTADLRIRAFADDEAWGTRTLELLTRALPVLEEEIGLPYPRLGEVVITESTGTGLPGFSEEPSSGTEIEVAFDQPDFTILHQAAHIWFSPALVQARWLREGLASHIVARAAPALDVDPPFDPAAQVTERAAAAFPLDAWTADAGPEGEAFGYAASWDVIDAVVEAVGADAVTATLVRASASIGPYQSAEVEPDPDAGGGAPTPLTTRTFLDHLETVTGQDLGALFASRVLIEADVALLPARATARTAFSELVEAGGSWPAPDPVRGAMTAWEFDDAMAQIEQAAAWLDRRDLLLAAMEEAGLSAPDRLRQAYRTYGGGPEAVDELEAEQAVVEAYTEVAGELTAERTFFERVGLVGGPAPEDRLNLANGRFADGDLRGALEAVTDAERIMVSAETGGIVRIASAILVAFIVLGLAVLLVRRRASYTAAP